MRFSSVLAAGVALLAGVIAATPVEFTNSVFGTLIAGQPFTLTWADATGPVTLTLKNGASSNLQTVATIATGLTGTSFVWTPSTSLASGSYALEITDGATSNYSPQFVLGGGSASAATVSGSATASGSASVTASRTTSSLPNLSSSTSVSSASSSASTATSTLSKTASSTASKSSSSSASSSATAASKTSSSTASSTSATATSTTHPPDSAAAGLASPLAFVLLAVAALITLN